jgi:hypothetical protein
MQQTNEDVNYKNTGNSTGKPAGGGASAAAGGGSFAGGGGDGDDQTVASALSMGSGGGKVITQGGAGAIKNDRTAAFKGAQGRAEGDVIREKGRTFTYKRIKDTKRKVVNRLGPDRDAVELDPGDPAPKPILPPRVAGDETDAAHEVHLTGIAFAVPKNPPKPIVPKSKRIKASADPAHRLAAEAAEEPKFPLYT